MLEILKTKSEVGGLSSTRKSFHVVRACAQCVCLDYMFILKMSLFFSNFVICFVCSPVLGSLFQLPPPAPTIVEPVSYTHLTLPTKA